MNEKKNKIESMFVVFARNTAILRFYVCNQILSDNLKFTFFKGRNIARHNDSVFNILWATTVKSSVIHQSSSLK